MLRANLKWKLVARLCLGSCLAATLAIGIAGCEPSAPDTTTNLVAVTSPNPVLNNTDGPLAEVNTPTSISKLAPSLEKFQPQVRILSPKLDEMLSDDRVSVKLQVDALPLFKNRELDLGNHLEVILDRQTYQEVFDLSQPLVFKNLAAGTHTLRVFAARPWHESFKNDGAYAQVTFHVLTKTAENQPDPQQPLLTYNRPLGVYGAEPIMLDYYVTNAPARVVGTEGQSSVTRWRLRVTINEQRFMLDSVGVASKNSIEAADREQRWTPVYLQGFQPGKNLVRLELVDDRGNLIPNAYNDTIEIVTYNPQAKDSLAKLIEGKLEPIVASAFVDPSYMVAINPAPAPTPAPDLASKPVITPVQIPTPAPTTTPAPAPVPSPIAAIPAPITKPSVSPVIIPVPSVSPQIEAPAQTPSQSNPKTPPKPSNSEPIDNSAQKDNLNKIPIAPTPTMTPSVQPSMPPLLIPVPVTIAPTPTVTVKPSVQPSTPPLLIPVPVAIAPTPAAATPSPTIVVQPSPAPEIVINRPEPSPQLTPPPIPTPKQTPTPQPVLAVKPSPSPAPQPPSVTPPSNPITASPQPQSQIEPKPEQTWQTQTLELAKIARAKIRKFTNTIPAKAQRFGKNLHTFAGNVMNWLEELRDRKIG
ncbi:hypothetical protein [Chamaesiphon minutus]|uniref:FHA domain containing protein n=1 Tax=Chamaesiphon minutus (strain ATCC 27169 / PCC 6605) TaxID=1173020 RepID=K9UH57_CHAP6|nr:hypothetical protein [Chamaesiphon minutus]AFY93983.1 hypothetical protein Cha6605_2951 [Chamaesiphon minutus PCC 6605]